MEARERSLQEYITRTGHNPFGNWLRSITDVATRARIRTRLSRLRVGNFGDTLVVLLGGGDKRSQSRDIAAAQRLWQEYKDDHAPERL